MRIAITSLILNILLFSNSFASQLIETRFERLAKTIFKSSQTGSFYLKKFQETHPLESMSFGRTINNDVYYFDYEHHIIFNEKLKNTSDEYLSWIILMALVDHELIDQTVVRFQTLLPALVEFELIIFNTSMEFLNELKISHPNFLINSATDLAWSTNNDFARNKKLSMTKFFNEWFEDKERFINHVINRTRIFNPKILTVEEFLESGNPTESQRRAAIVLEDIWYEINPLQTGF